VKTEPEILTEKVLDDLFSNEEKDVFDSVPARLAFVFRKYGPDELKECLFPQGVPENLQRRLLAEGLPPDYDRETLLDAHDELLALGLTAAAKIILEVSALTQSRFHMPSPPWVRDSRTWEDRERKRKQWEAERARRLSHLALDAMHCAGAKS
jgi:hypothetical protein